MVGIEKGINSPSLVNFGKKHGVLEKKTEQQPQVLQEKNLTKVDSDSLKAYHLTKVSPAKIGFGRALEDHLGLGARFTDDGKLKIRLHAPYVNALEPENKIAKVEVEVREVDKEENNPTPFKTANETELKEHYNTENPGQTKTFEMKETKPGSGVVEASVNGINPDKRYQYRYVITYESGQQEKVNDPRSDFMPNDIYGWSEAVDHKAFDWGKAEEKWINGQVVGGGKRLSHDNKAGHLGAPANMVVSEEHVGLLRDSVIDPNNPQVDLKSGYLKAKQQIDKIAEQGICNTVELMPIGEFFGKNNWGYDEVGKFSPESSYGRPEDLKELVKHAHEKGLNVVIDVVPNHFGAFGNFLGKMGPAWDKWSNTPWGAAINYERGGKEYMRNYVVDNALNWVVNYHADALRFDMTQFMASDNTMKLIAAEIRNHPEAKDTVLIAEDGRNSKRVTNGLTADEIRNPEKVEKGSVLDNLGFDAQWDFDASHVLEGLFTGTEVMDGAGPHVRNLEKIFQRGYLHFNDGGHMADPAASTNVYYHTSHDEIGNRGGTRLPVKIIANKIGIYNGRVNGDGKKADGVMFDLIKSYLGDKELFKNPQKQRAIGINSPVSLNEMKNAYEQAKALDKASIATVFMLQGPKMFMTGDLEFELAPFRFFADYPEGFSFKRDGQDVNLKNHVSEEKGYEIGEKSFKESLLNTEEYTDANAKSQVLRFSQDVSKLFKENPVLQNGESMNNTKTYCYDNANVMHIHRYNDRTGHEKGEIVQVLNPTDRFYDNFTLRDFPEGKWVQVLNSDSKEYGGSGQFENSKEIPLERDKNGNLNIKLSANSTVFLKSVE